MYSETLGLGRARDAEQARRFAGIISREADRLTGLIQRILDFSSQEAGRFTYQREDVDASALLRTVTDDYRPHVETAHGRITADLEPGLRLHTDPGALASAYLNLLENAVKYTPADAPDRSIEVELRSSDGHAVLEVRDRGVGVPATEREHIFESFYRATTAGEVRGAGLGLSLVRHFAEAHDGTIAALPRDGGGSVFRLRLPLHRRDAR
jgi:two-component system phosphate regulon sensor histidine kinase PhoR